MRLYGVTSTRRDPHPAVDEDRQRQQRVSRRPGEVEVKVLAEGPVKEGQGHRVSPMRIEM